MATFLVVKARQADLGDILAGKAPVYQETRGFGAEATAEVGEDGVITVTVDKAGSGYLVAPKVRLETFAKGYNAVAVAEVEDGKVTEITVDQSQANLYEEGDAVRVVVEDTFVVAPRYIVGGTPDTTTIRWCGGDVYAITIPDAELSDEPKSDDASSDGSDGEEVTPPDGGEGVTPDDGGETPPAEDGGETPPAEDGGETPPASGDDTTVDPRKTQLRAS